MCENLLVNNGEYRLHESKPLGEDIVYVKAEMIDTEMESLFKHTRQLYAEYCHSLNCDQLEGLIKLSAIFYSNFLQIHPFSNGNGRVARLLFGLITLTPQTQIPATLTVQQSNYFTLNTAIDYSKRYLQCLREAQRTIPIRPDALCTFILESIHASTNFVYELMGDE